MHTIVLEVTHNGFDKMTLSGPWYLFGNYCTSQMNEEDLLDVVSTTSRVIAGEIDDTVLTDDYIELTISHKTRTAHLIMDKPNRPDYESEMPLQAFYHLVNIWCEYRRLTECIRLTG